MAERLKPVDVVVVGLGAGGGTAVWPLAEAGLKVVGIEAGPHVTFSDYPFDEIRNDIRDYMGRFKANKEVPTTRRLSSEQATRPLGATGPMMNAVGGTSHSLDDPELALSPVELQGPLRDDQAIRRRRDAGRLDGHRLAVRLRGTRAVVRQGRVSPRRLRAGRERQGQDRPAGNIFEGPRARPYPNPPLRRSGWNDLTFQAAKDVGVHPYPGPTGIRSRPYHGFAQCTYCGFCGWTGCWTGAKASTNLHFIPQAVKTGNLKIEDLSRVLEVNVDKDGKASGVTYLKGGRSTSSRPRSSCSRAISTRIPVCCCCRRPRPTRTACQTITDRSGRTTWGMGWRRRRSAACSRGRSSTCTVGRSGSTRRSTTGTPTTSTTPDSGSFRAAW